MQNCISQATGSKNRVAIMTTRQYVWLCSSSLSVETSALSSSFQIVQGVCTRCLSGNPGTEGLGGHMGSAILLAGLRLVAFIPAAGTSAMEKAGLERASAYQMAGPPRHSQQGQVQSCGSRGRLPGI